MIQNVHRTNLWSENGQSNAEPRLVSAAHEFEAQMMKELLDPLVTGDTSAEVDGDAGLGLHSAIGSFAGEALGRALSSHGGFGIATNVIKSFSRNGSVS